MFFRKDIKEIIGKKCQTFTIEKNWRSKNLPEKETERKFEENH